MQHGMPSRHAPRAHILCAWFALTTPWAISSCSAHENENELIGCWEGISVVQSFPDGSEKRNEGSRCTLEFRESSIVTRCSGVDGDSMTEYAYTLLGNNAYTATITRHSHRHDLVGNTRDYAYRVDTGRLVITTFPQTSVPSPPTRAVRVDSESRRVACDEASTEAPPP